MKIQKKRVFLWGIWVIAWMLWLCPASSEAATRLAKPPVPTVHNPGDGIAYVGLDRTAVANADGFNVYVSSRKDGEYEQVDSWWPYYDETAEDTCVCRVYTSRFAPGRYYVKVRSFRINKKGKYKYSAFSDVADFEVTWKLKAVPGGNDRVRLTADRTEGPVGSPVEEKSPQEYEICRSTSKNGTYTVLKTCDSYDYREDGDCIYEDRQCTLGNSYYYKVRALFYDEAAYEDYLYEEDNEWYDDDGYNPDLLEDTNRENTGGYTDGVTTEKTSAAGSGALTQGTTESGNGGGSASGNGSRQRVKPQPVYVLETNVTEGHPGPLSTESLKSKALKGNKLSLSWKSVQGVDGYYLYEVAGATGTRKKITKVSNTSYTWKKRKHAEKYEIVVVPYIMAGGKEVQGADSQTFSAVMNYYTSPYDDKLTRFFGKNASKKMAVYQKRKSEGKPYFKTQAKAERQMKTIRIRVWDFAHGKSGKKITRTFYLTVHKMVAPSLKKAFEEIYKGKEKFPIHDIGGYSYRWGQHGVGLAMDINVNENAHFTNGVADVGNYYRPGKDPYSIPRDGELARILGKYGFLQLEGDYMHFSYFGT